MEYCFTPRGPTLLASPAATAAKGASGEGAVSAATGLKGDIAPLSARSDGSGWTRVVDDAATPIGLTRVMDDAATPRGTVKHDKIMKAVKLCIDRVQTLSEQFVKLESSCHRDLRTLEHRLVEHVDCRVEQMEIAHGNDITENMQRILGNIAVLITDFIGGNIGERFDSIEEMLGKLRCENKDLRADLKTKSEASALGLVRLEDMEYSVQFLKKHVPLCFDRVAQDIQTLFQTSKLASHASRCFPDFDGEGDSSTPGIGARISSRSGRSVQESSSGSRKSIKSSAQEAALSEGKGAPGFGRRSLSLAARLGRALLPGSGGGKRGAARGRR